MYYYRRFGSGSIVLDEPQVYNNITIHNVNYKSLLAVCIMCANYALQSKCFFLCLHSDASSFLSFKVHSSGLKII